MSHKVETSMFNLALKKGISSKYAISFISHIASYLFQRGDFNE